MKYKFLPSNNTLPVSNTSSLVILVLGLTCTALLFFVFGKSQQDISFEDKAPLAQYALEAVSQCAKATHRPSCYDRAIPKLTERVSLEDAFYVTRLVQEKDPSYTYCHVLGHALSARETEKEPSRWKEVVARCPSGMCSNGCLHGSFQERFRTEAMPEANIETLLLELGGICVRRAGWGPTDLERATCYHAWGHLAMYVTEADIEKSALLCEQIVQRESGGQFIQICYDGAFMQIFQPLEPEDFVLVEGKQPFKEGLRDFCWKFQGKKRSSCWSEGWPLFFKEIKTPDGLVAFCSTLKDGIEETRCFSALFYVLVAQFNFDETRIIPFCKGLPDARVGQCFANASSRFIETDYRNIKKSVNMCRVAESLGKGEVCFQELLTYSTYNFHVGSAEFYELCQSLPKPWSERCLLRSR